MAEVELKLAATAGALTPAKRALLEMAGRDDAAPATLVSTYYDTADRLLQRRGLTLRVRNRNGEYVQTVKAEDPGSALPFSRGEWEDAITGALPDCNAPNSGPRLPDAAGAAAFHPLFTTVVRRAVVTVEPDEHTAVEGALDEGEIRTAATGRTAPICEVELELKRGDPAAIYDIGLSLAKIAPLRIEPRSKSERGFALIDGETDKPQVVHPPAVVLDPAMRVEEALQKFGRDCLEIILRNEPAALAGMPDGVHQMRVGIRRLRAALALFKRMLPPDQFDQVEAELKWLSGSLGPARNWDVFASGILPKVKSALVSGGELEALSERTERERRQAHAAAAAALRSPRYTTAILELSRWLTARGWRDQAVSEQSALLMAPIGRVASGLLARCADKVRKRSKGFADLDLRRRHRLRIAVKKMRYATDLLESLYDAGKVSQFVRRLKPLQDELGHVNDVRTAGDLLRPSENGAGTERAAGAVLGWHERGLRDHERRLQKRLRRFKRAQPFW
jgi:inorganic triphosphatase YgiF